MVAIYPMSGKILLFSRVTEVAQRENDTIVGLSVTTHSDQVLWEKW